MKQEENSSIHIDAKEIFHEALDFAQQLDDSKYMVNCIASLGILEGENQFSKFLDAVKKGQIGNISQTSSAGSDVRKSQIFQEKIKPEIDFQDS